MADETTNKNCPNTSTYHYARLNWQKNHNNNLVAGSLTPSQYRGKRFNATDSFSGSKLPNWKQRVRTHQDATTAASGTKYSESVSNYQCWNQLVQAIDVNFPNRRNTWFNSVQGYLPYNVPASFAVTEPTSAILAQARDQAMRKFISTVHETRSATAAGESAIELRQTLNTIRHPMKSLYRLTVDYLYRVKGRRYLRRRGYSETTIKRMMGRKSVLPRGREATRALTDSYLEYSFGIKPYEQQIADILVKAGRVRFDYIPVRAGAKVEHSASSGTYSVPGLVYAADELALDIMSRVIYVYRGQVKLKTDAEGKLSKAQEYRLLPEDWGPTAYNVLPWSWMLDYVTNVGDMVEALCFRTGNLAWWNTSSIRETEYRYTRRFPLALNEPSTAFPWANPVITGNSSGGDALFRCRKFNRYKATQSDFMPDFHLKIPQRATQYLNVFAIALQALSK